MKLQLDRVLVVEGKYDKMKLSSLVQGVIIEVGGFGIFKDREKMEYLRALAAKRGLIVLTDSDGAGFLIRHKLSSCIPHHQLKHAYIPDILGKERRKAAPSKEGKLGVEGMELSVLRQALERAGAKLGVNGVTIAGFFVSLASIVPAYATMKDMNVRGKVLVSAFTATSANILGPHLGYVASVNENYIIPMMGAKVAAALIGLPVALFFCKRLFEKEGAV